MTYTIPSIETQSLDWTQQDLAIIWRNLAVWDALSPEVQEAVASEVDRLIASPSVSPSEKVRLNEGLKLAAMSPEERKAFLEGTRER